MTEPLHDDAEIAAARRRLRGFGYHLLGYFAVMAILVPINFIVTPGEPWFVLPMVGWGAALGLHAAYAMNLFRGLFGGRRGGRDDRRR